MKYLVFVIIILSSVLNGQWLKTDQPFTDEYLHSVFFVNQNVGWITGANGAIFKTIDAGKNWQKVNINYYAAFHGIFFINENKGWAYNSSGVLFLTDDGGGNWEEHNLEFPINSICFTDENNGWIASTRIQHTSDGGKTWNQVITEQMGFNDIVFIDKLNGYASGYGVGGVLKTNDGGQNWSPVFSISPPGNMFFLDKSNGWVTSYDGIYLTIDGTKNWKKVTLDKNYNIVKIYFIDDLHGWILTQPSVELRNENSILYTDDGGLTWNKQVNPSSNRYYDIYFSDINTGWIVGSDGIVLKSLNSGTTETSSLIPTLEWKNPTPTSKQINSIWFIDEFTGFICTSSGYIYKTINAGTDWIRIDLKTKSDLKKIQFVNSNVGFILAIDGTIFITKDGGQNWERNETIDELSRFTSFEFLNENYGWLVGTDSEYTNVSSFYKTEDGGKNWEKPDYKSFNGATAIEMIDSLNGWAVGNGGTLLRTKDAGNNWEDYSQYNPNNYRNSIYFKNRQIGWRFISYSDNRGNRYNSTYYTNDSGNTWSNYKINGEDLHTVYFLNNDIGWAIALNSKLYQTTDSGISWNIKGNISTNNSFFFLNDEIIYAAKEKILKTKNSGITWERLDKGERGNLNSIDFADSLNGIVVGENGIILTTKDKGISWIKSDSTTNLNLHTVSFVDKNNCWAAGDSGVIIKSQDGGKIWVQQQSNYSGNIMSIFFYDSNNGWAVGPGEYMSDRYILKTINGGETWNKIDLGFEESYKSIWFNSSNLGWIVSGNGQIFKTLNGGLDWQFQDLGAAPEYWFENFTNSIFFLDDQVGWVCGDKGFISKTNNGGEFWQEQYSGISKDLSQIKFLDIYNGFAVGSENTLLFTNDGGNSWQEQLPSYFSFDPDIKSIEIIDKNNIWFSGGNGTIIKGNLVEAVSGNNTGGSDDTTSTTKPENFKLFQNYPNPFNGYTTIQYSLPAAAKVNIKLFDVLGREVKTLVNSEKEVGNYKVELNADQLSSGIYFYKLQTEKFSTVKKMILMK